LEKALDTVAAHLERPLIMLRDSHERATLLLSGGLDSTILGGLCKKMGLAIDSASSGFHEITGDLGESHYAQTAADWFGFDHRIHDIGGEDYISALVDSIAVAEEPVHHLQSAVLGSMFARGIDPSVKYLVNGEGADGLFGSAVHVRYLKSRRITRFSDHRLLRALAVPLLSPLSGGNERLRYLLQDHSHDHADDAHFLWTVVSFGDIDWVRAHFGRGLGPIVEGRRKFLDHYKDWSVLDRLTLLQYTSEVDETMKIWGKLAEHSGRVMIYPFSNPDLIFALFNIGWKLKGREPKYLLRKLAARLGVPDQIINRPKRGFGFPARFWAPPGALFQPLIDMAGEMFDPRLLRSLQVEDPGRAMVLWGFLNIYLWHKTLIQNVPAVDIREEIAARRKSGERVVA
jgi:asparagine synthetase B (glutamine-hydrolysing)